MGGSLGVSNRIAFTALDCSGRRLTLWVTVTFWANDVEAHVTSRNSPTTLRCIASSAEVSAAIVRASRRPCQAVNGLSEQCRYVGSLFENWRGLGVAAATLCSPF